MIGVHCAQPVEETEEARERREEREKEERHLTLEEWQVGSAMCVLCSLSARASSCVGQAKQEKLQNNFNTRQVKDKLAGEVTTKQADEDDEQ